MFKKFNQYLLTHYPTLWNFRWPIVMGISILLHVIFFLVGFMSVQAPLLGHISSVKHLFTYSTALMSMMCTFIIEIIWLIYLLRNNAYKNFYKLDNWHGVKSFLLILSVLFVSGTLYESYFFGLRKKVNYITSEKKYKEEQKIVNEAMAFLPIENVNYFKENNVKNGSISNESYNYYLNAANNGFSNIFFKRVITENNDTIFTKATSKEYETTPNKNIKIDYFIDSLYLNCKIANTLPNAFAFENYGATFIKDFGTEKDYQQYSRYRSKSSDFFEKDPAFNSAINTTIKNILIKKDSVALKTLLTNFKLICNKYKIGNNINEDKVLRDVFTNINIKVDLKKIIRNSVKQNYKSNLTEPFTDSRFFRTTLLKSEKQESNYKNYYSNNNDDDLIYTANIQPNYLEADKLNRAFELINGTLNYNEDFDLNTKTLFAFALFVSICFTILLFIYRRTNGRVFLFSVIGSIGWMIVSGLVSALIYMNELRNNLPELLMFIYFIFVVVLCLSMFFILKKRKSKTWAGIWLSWFAFLLPFIGPAITVFLGGECEEFYAANEIIYITPFYCAIKSNWPNILMFWVGILLLIAPFILSKLTKLWHTMADE